MTKVNQCLCLVASIVFSFLNESLLSGIFLATAVIVNEIGRNRNV